MRTKFSWRIPLLRNNSAGGSISCEIREQAIEPEHGKLFFLCIAPHWNRNAYILVPGRSGSLVTSAGKRAMPTGLTRNLSTQYAPGRSIISILLADLLPEL